MRPLCNVKCTTTISEGMLASSPIRSPWPKMILRAQGNAGIFWIVFKEDSGVSLMLLTFTFGQMRFSLTPLPDG